MNEEQQAALREPFPPEQIGKLPRAGILLDFVGHADVCDRLLKCDPNWTWEPAAWDMDGTPLVAHRGNDAVMWIRLTIHDVTRLGVGIVSAKAFELEKQLISDALRNAAMRFGVALDLWSKSDLSDQGAGQGDRPEPGKLGNVDEMKPAQLNAALAERGLEQGGTVKQMRDRLREHAAQEAQDEFVGVDTTAGPDPVPDVEGSATPAETDDANPSAAPSTPVPDAPFGYLDQPELAGTDA